MDWCRLDTSFYLDPAVIRAGEQAEVLFLRCLAYSGSKETRGLVPKGVLPMLAPVSTKARMQALIDNGLVIDMGADLLIRSWERWQESLDKESDRRKKDRERKAAERAAVRAGVHGQSTDSPADESTDTAQDIPRTFPRIEVEVEEERTTPSRMRSDSEPEGFAAFWLAYPRKTAKPNALKAYRKALKDTAASVLLEGASSYARERQGQDVKFTAHPATWLNDRRWEDEAAPAQRPSFDTWAPQDPMLMPPAMHWSNRRAAGDDD